MSADFNEKYLDPKTNDFLPQPQPEETAPDPHPERAGLSPEARAIAELVDSTTSIEDYRVPFATADELSEAADTDATTLNRDIARLYPGRNEIELDGITVSRMVGGSYTVNSFPLRELSAAYLGRLRAAVRGR